MIGLTTSPAVETVAEAWQRDYAREPGGLGALLEPEVDRFKNLDKSALPAHGIEADLGYALVLKYLHKEPDACEALLDRALSVAQRVRSDRLCDKGPLPASCHLQLERAEAYVRWVKDARLDVERLRAAYEFAMQSVREDDDDQYFAEGHALAAARIALVAEMPALVEPALQSRKQWSGVAAIKMRDVLAKLAQLQLGKSDESQQVVQDALSDLFDIYRWPYPDKVQSDLKGSVTVIRFELGVMMQRLQARNDESFDLERVYALVVA